MRKHNEDKLGISYRMRREEFDKQFILKFHDLVMRMVNLSIIPNIEAIKRGFGFTVYDGSELLKWVDGEIDSQLQSVFEEIEKTADYLQHRKEQELHGGYDDADFLQAYELGLTDLKWKLKSLRQKYISGEKEEK